MKYYGIGASKKQHRDRHSKITSSSKVITHAEKNKWIWAGHFARLQNIRWSKKLTY